MREGVVTHREAITFPYTSYRDESGVLTLECDREKVMEKVYVKLNLKSNIAFVLKTVFIIGIKVEIKKWGPGESKLLPDLIFSFVLEIMSLVE